MRWMFLLVAGFAIGFLGFVPWPDVALDIQWSVPAFPRQSYLPDARIDEGEELMLVFVGSSRCHWSSHPELPELVRHAKLAIRSRAENEEMGFAALGIARDVAVHAGLEHLATFGEFDEVMAGRGWLNTGVLQYVYNEFPGRAATPQVVVLRRRVAIEGGQRSIEDEHVILRKVGLTQIRTWVESGMTLGS